MVVVLALVISEQQNVSPAVTLYYNSLQKMLSTHYYLIPDTTIHNTIQWPQECENSRV